MTESQLVERCRQGDRDAQRELYARTCDRIYRLLLRMTHDPDDASDLTQSAYVRVFQNIQQFKQSSGLTTWVYRIAVNEALQWLRSEKRRGFRHLKGQSHRHSMSEADATEARIDVEIALARLTDEERALVTLRYFDDLSYVEISGILGRPSGTIGSELNRIRHKLRNCLAPETFLES